MSMNSIAFHLFRGLGEGNAVKIQSEAVAKSINHNPHFFFQVAAEIRLQRHSSLSRPLLGASYFPPGARSLFILPVD
jgi:hypothetical protein